jgi:hypothetical protein
VDLYIHSPIRFHGVVLNWLSTGTTFNFAVHGFISQKTELFLTTAVRTHILHSALWLYQPASYKSDIKPWCGNNIRWTIIDYTFML